MERKHYILAAGIGAALGMAHLVLFPSSHGHYYDDAATYEYDDSAYGGRISDGYIGRFTPGVKENAPVADGYYGDGPCTDKCTFIVPGEPEDRKKGGDDYSYDGDYSSDYGTWPRK
jgi:hypothetical protein